MRYEHCHYYNGWAMKWRQAKTAHFVFPMADVELPLFLDSIFFFFSNPRMLHISRVAQQDTV